MSNPQPASAAERLVREFSALAISKTQFAPRPDNGGRAGRAIRVLVNVYKIALSFNADISHYDVEIKHIKHSHNPSAPPSSGTSEPRALPPKLAREVLKRVAVEHPAVAPKLSVSAYDGKANLLCTGDLPLGAAHVKTFPVTVNDNFDTNSMVKGGRFEKTLPLDKLRDYIALVAGGTGFTETVATTIQAFDVLFRHDPASSAGHVVAAQGRKFLTIDGGSDIGGGAQVLRGFFYSVRPTRVGMVINIDTASSPYLASGNLYRIMCAILGRPPTPVRQLGQEEVRIVRRRLKGAKVRVTHRPEAKTYTIEDFGNPAGSQELSIQDRGRRPPAPSATAVAQAAAAGTPMDPSRPEGTSQKMSLIQYFKKTYNKQCSPDLHCVKLRGGGGFVPVECLELLPGNSISATSLSAQQAAKMIDVTRRDPSARLQEVGAIRANAGFDNNARIKGWNTTVAREMVVVEARILPAPSVQYLAKSKRPGDGAIVPRFGGWNVMNSRFFKPGAPLKTWGIVCILPKTPFNEKGVEDFFKTFVAKLEAVGIPVPQKELKVFFKEENEDLVTTVRGVCRGFVQAGAPPQILFFVVNERTSYPVLKRVAYMEMPLPIANLCLMASHVLKDTRRFGPNDHKRRDQYCSNVALKTNIQLGGVNSVVLPKDLPPQFTSSTMIFGADVGHPPQTRSRSEEVQSSIAGVVATMDSHGASCSFQVREQEGRVEIISELSEMAEALIKKWVKINKTKPQKLLFFRDGVGEGQFAAVVDHEVRAIKEACAKIDPSWKPTLTFIVCLKRHHIRFHAQNQKDTDGKTGNLPAGTVCDSDIVHPYLWEFYLQAHSGLIGTAKPTRYVCLLDENKFKSDDIQKLTNAMCYNFARATRSVSLIHVAYYADLLCEKARALVYDDDASSSVASGSSTRRPSTFIQEKLERTAANHSFPSMWFM